MARRAVSRKTTQMKRLRALSDLKILQSAAAISKDKKRVGEAHREAQRQIQSLASVKIESRSAK